MNDQPKGTAAAILIFIRQNPKLNKKELANILHISIRRVQQVTKKYAKQVAH